MKVHVNSGKVAAKKPTGSAMIAVAAVVEAAAANPFLSADGMINTASLQALGKALDKAAGPDAKATGVYCVLKKLPAKYAAAPAKKGDHKYLTSRSIEIKKYARIGKVPRPLLFKSYDLSVLPAALKAKQKQAISAVVAHNKKALSTKTTVKTAKQKISAQLNKEFDKNLDVVFDLLKDAGIAEKNIFTGQSMFGKTVFVTLPHGGVITIGKSSAEALKKAKAAAKKAATAA